MSAYYQKPNMRDTWQDRGVEKQRKLRSRLGWRGVERSEKTISRFLLNLFQAAFDLASPDHALFSCTTLRDIQRAGFIGVVAVSNAQGELGQVRFSPGVNGRLDVDYYNRRLNSAFSVSMEGAIKVISIVHRGEVPHE